MPLTPGSRVGPYEILAPLGAGGMGEVFRARDVRLERTVALKSLPAAFARDAERRARFEREARLLASLNHANIAAIYGLEDGADAPYLVLEFVDGETLAQRLARGPLPLSEALAVCGQIASAIEAAHERGVVHRDLKPGNVMLAASRAVKVLDFGLAKAAEGAASTASNLSASPTQPLSATVQGAILGTAQYMSPEQARGKAVDRRADIWAFGCILFECLTGRHAFAGETLSDVIARILEREPDWSLLPVRVPGRLRDLLRRCLTKDAEARPRDIGDLRRELATIAAETAAPGGAAAAVELPSLAVLYFENLTRDPDSEYFCAGITEDILTDLSKIKGLRVASRNAVARYRGAPVEIARVGVELGVQTVLEGSVRRAGDRVRISAQLINVVDGFHVWADRFDRTLADVFAVQEEIASSIAAALQVALTPAETRALVQNRPSDARAYDLYLKGRDRYGHYSPESLREALALFQQATEVDPHYALAWAGIADCYGQFGQLGGVGDPAENVRLGLAAARRALSLDPRLPEAHKAESLVLRVAGDHAGARAALVRALEANPRFTPALVNLAVDRFTNADLAGAERLIRRALEVDPQEAFATTWLLYIAVLTGRDDEVMATALRLRELTDNSFYLSASHDLRVWLHVMRGDLDRAERVAREGAAEGVDASSREAAKALIAARAGRMDEARRIVHELETAKSTRLGALRNAAVAALAVGEADLAVRCMFRRPGDVSAVQVRLDPEAHALLDREPYAPRHMDATLVWPLEAPMIPPACHALFRDVRIESGRPKGSGID